MPSIRHTTRRITKLSELDINTDKNWVKRSIENMGTLVANVVDVGDILFRHGWRMFEREDALYVEKDNKLFKIKLEEVRT